ncbi:MAG: flagellar export chaperone FliS [Woeseiaceae bacterium]
MTLSGTPAAQQYQKIDTISNIEDASPHRIIQMLMERALVRIGQARGYMERDEVPSKGESLGDAIDIIEGLQASLNHDADERMSENFDALYAYMMRRLLEANLRNDKAILDEVSALLRELKEAWDAIGDEV